MMNSMLGRKSLLWFAAAISVLTFTTVATANAASRERPCNGSVDLCSRTFDQVTLPGTHNSMSNEEYGWLIPNQHYSIPTQLDYGVRAFLVDTHYGKDNGDGTVSNVPKAQRNDPGVKMYFCHEYCSLGFSELIPELAKVADFLSSHPREVLAFVVQDGLVPEDLATAVTDSGLIDYVYRGSTEQYPTLSEMISTNQRVVMLSENDTGDVPWYHDGYGGPMQETPYDFRYGNASMQTQVAMANLTETGNLYDSCQPNRGGTTGKLFLMNHWVNGPLVGPGNIAPDPAVAAVLNQPDVLVNRATACKQRRGMFPTIVAVDDFGEGDLTDAVRQLNGVTAKPFFEVTRTKNATVRAGRKATYRLTVSNWGDAESALTKVCATVPARLAVKPKCRTFFVPQANPGKATTSLTIASRGKGKGTGPVKFTISGGGDSVTTSASLTVKQVKKKKPKRNRR